MIAPSTQTSCWRVANRAKARPWAGKGTYRWAMASKDGWASDPATPDEQGQHRLGRDRAPGGGADGGQGDEPDRAQEDLLLAQPLAQPGHDGQPDRAPTPLAPSTSPYHHRAACSRRRPKATRKTMNPDSPRSATWWSARTAPRGGRSAAAGPGRRPGRVRQLAVLEPSPRRRGLAGACGTGRREAGRRREADGGMGRRIPARRRRRRRRRPAPAPPGPRPASTGSRRAGRRRTRPACPAV